MPESRAGHCLASCPLAIRCPAGRLIAIVARRPRMGLGFIVPEACPALEPNPSHPFSCVSRARVRHSVAASLILPFLRKPCNGCIAVHRRLILSESPVTQAAFITSPIRAYTLPYYPPPPIIQLHLNPRLHTTALILPPTLLRPPPPSSAHEHSHRHPSTYRSCYFLDSQLDVDVTFQPGLLLRTFLALMSC